ncbi:carbon storage regulator [Paenibacillus luteus]|uniref:carbon storage regulator n=1 Tax=Paenibacillus luteus TaxID=2545753 RepID=UPI0011419C2A|nr:carbon storage regulator [Paenibacillus luteus]
MLVLGRKPGEYVVINEKIIVKVVKSKDGLLRLAIDAPRDIQIMRGELFEEQKHSSLLESQK